MEWTNGLWTFNGESAKRIGHPAPFPRQLPYRAIKLFSFVRDVVFDPFCGSGTTLIEAANNNRFGVGVELDEQYCKLAKHRILKETSSLSFTEKKYDTKRTRSGIFKKRPNKDIPHPEIVDWVVNEWEKLKGEKFRDPDRQIRALKDEGILIKVKKGVYRYDPTLVKKRKLQNFTEEQKKQILKRDGYKCVICGRGVKDGVELHIDYIKPREHRGDATIENGQVLCGPHNYMKKHFKQTETGKKMFIRLYELAKAKNNAELIKFCTEVLEVFERNNINGHIIWKK